MSMSGHDVFSGGKLPWQGVRCESIRKRYQIIGHIKGETKIATLSNGFPGEFAMYMQYCCNLKFGQAPDYTYLQQLFRRCMQRNQIREDAIFDWTDVEEAQEISQQQERESQGLYFWDSFLMAFLKVIILLLLDLTQIFTAPCRLKKSFYILGGLLEESRASAQTFLPKQTYTK